MAELLYGLIVRPFGE